MNAIGMRHASRWRELVARQSPARDSVASTAPGRRAWLVIAQLAIATAVSGCAGFSADGGLGPVAQIARERLDKDLIVAEGLKDNEVIRQRVAELLDDAGGRTLSVDDAIQIALLNNRGLQADMRELGISEADLVQAGRLPNPRFSMLRASRGGDYKIEQALTFNVMALLVMPLATDIEKRRFARSQQQVALQILGLAAATRKAYYLAVSTQETLRYQRQVEQAALASAELAANMKRVGNWNVLSQARQQAFYADAALASARAEQARVGAIERLLVCLGLWGEQSARVLTMLPPRLPDMPAEPDELSGLEQRAMAERLDLLIAREDNQALAARLGLTRVTRFVNVLELGPARVLEGTSSDPYKNGVEVAFELPLFDWSTARVRRAESLYLQSVDRAAELAVRSRSEVRHAHQQYRLAYDVARHYRDEVVPLRRRIGDENLLRYNGMLISVFDLLADARAQIASVNDYLDALRDYWLAQADLMMVVSGPLAASAAWVSPVGRSQP